MSPNAGIQCGLLIEPEHTDLIKVTKLIGHLFRLPITYVALFGSDQVVSIRIGSGEKHWASLGTCSPESLIAHTETWSDPAAQQKEEFCCGDVKFAAGVPLRTTDGLNLGLLVVADVKARPEFSKDDRKTLQGFAELLTERMELRLIASQASELALKVEEAESRFQSIANSASVMIIYAGVDGGCAFVNEAWLEFTGRGLAEELGDGYAETFHPSHRERILRRYWDAFRKREPVTLEFPMRHRDGEYRWVQARGVPRFLDCQRYSGYVGCFVELGKELTLDPGDGIRSDARIEAPESILTS